MLKENLSSKDLDLSYSFSILGLEYRVLEVKLLGTLRDLGKYEVDSRFEWFMEDLIFFIEKNKFQKRWDFETIKLKNLNTLSLNKVDKELFIKLFKTVTNWDMELEW